MESTAETKKQPLSNKTVIIIAALVVVAVVAIAAMILFQPKADDNTIGYATEAKVMLDQESLQAAMDQAIANAKDGNIALLYKNNAYSTDGTNFECYIVNSASNSYDMFLTIFADAELQDQVFLSQLLRPGSGFENITLDHALETGDHTVYVAVTQVKNDENGEQVIHNQVMHTMDFHVTQ